MLAGGGGQGDVPGQVSSAVAAVNNAARSIAMTLLRHPAAAALTATATATGRPRELRAPHTTDTPAGVRCALAAVATSECAGVSGVVQLRWSVAGCSYPGTSRIVAGMPLASWHSS